MPKSGILVRFTTSAANYNGRLAISAYDSDGTRRYQLVEGLKNPNYKDWDQKLQLFYPPTKENQDNNEVLAETRTLLEILIRTRKARTADQLLAMFKDEEYVGKYRKECFMEAEEDAQGGLTLGKYVQGLSEAMKADGFSQNYQLYQSLHHNLIGVSKKCPKKAPVKFECASLNHMKLCDTPLEDIGNTHLAAFSEWIKRVKKGSNYRGLTVALMAVLRRAKQEGLNHNDLTYSFTKNAPRKAVKSLSGALQEHVKPKSLTPKQIHEAFSIDIGSIKVADPSVLVRQRMYLDTARLMYLLMSRPADVVSMRWDMVVSYRGEHYLSYIPFKKKGYADPTKHIVKMPICPEAMEIMMKYKGQSKLGYILPYPDNDRVYDLSTAAGTREWTLGIKRSVRKVDTFLKIVGKHLGLDWPLSLYAFRRSSITHSLEAGVNVLKVAKRAGTGLDMIDKHYYMDQVI